MQARHRRSDSAQSKLASLAGCVSDDVTATCLATCAPSSNTSATLKSTHGSAQSSSNRTPSRMASFKRVQHEMPPRHARSRLATRTCQNAIHGGQLWYCVHKTTRHATGRERWTETIHIRLESRYRIRQRTNCESNYWLPFTRPDGRHGELYFANAHPLYGILDVEWFMKQIMLRYSTQKPVQCPDHLMAGVAALGTLFGDGGLNSILPALIDSAKLSLESTSTMQPATIYDVQSWILRVVYLRATGHPHACWMASSITMHIIESCGLQQESTSSSVMYPPTNDHMNDLEIRRRTFWIARLLNTWVSFEYGRNRVALRGITCKLPVHREGDFTREYIDLYSISCCLDPDNADKPTQWEDFLRQLEQYDAPHDCMELSRANLGLCAYRRIRLGNPNLPSETINRIIAIGLGGLKAAQNLAKQGMPWWHVANVPFNASASSWRLTHESLFPILARPCAHSKWW